MQNFQQLTNLEARIRVREKHDDKPAHVPDGEHIVGDPDVRCFNSGSLSSTSDCSLYVECAVLESCPGSQREHPMRMTTSSREPLLTQIEQMISMIVQILDLKATEIETFDFKTTEIETSEQTS